uniref:Ferredoxin n=1 Tax=Globodera pallida TaxID=36090 RepID=A0A183CQU0_GLOPA
VDVELDDDPIKQQQSVGLSAIQPECSGVDGA